MNTGHGHRHRNFIEDCTVKNYNYELSYYNITLKFGIIMPIEKSFEGTVDFHANKKTTYENTLAVRKRI
jgi:hypothetical protein